MKRFQPVIDRLFRVLCQIVPLEPAVHDYLSDVMTAHPIQRDTVLHRIGETIDRAYFVSEGLVISYFMKPNGERMIAGIYGAGDLIVTQSLVEQSPCSYVLEAEAGTYLLSIRLENIRAGYARFPAVLALALRILAGREGRKMARIRMLALPKPARVAAFYQVYPLLNQRGVLKDADVAAYLLMSQSRLREFRHALVRAGQLPPYQK